MIRGAQLFGAVLVCALMHVPAAVAQSDFSLLFPVDCQLGETCFLQQLVDVDPAEGFQDPVCGSASYDGHTGTDIRTAQLVDLSYAGDVLAAAAGTVRGLRDGMPDRMIFTDEDRAAVGNRDCGNGVLIEHREGYQTQYCHMAQDSVAVGVGQEVEAGDYLGTIGLSGSTQFPHLEFIVRKDGVTLDPFTGGTLDAGCQSANASLWQDKGLLEEARATTQLIGAGFSTDVIDHGGLIEADPVQIYAGAGAVVAWAWGINVNPGDVYVVEISGPDGYSFQTTSEPLSRRQASHAYSAGQSVPVVPGHYRGLVQIVRADQVVSERAFSQVIEASQ